MIIAYSRTTTCNARPAMGSGIGLGCAHVCTLKKTRRKGLSHPDEYHLCICGYQWGKKKSKYGGMAGYKS